MSTDPAFTIWVFFAFLCQIVCGFVPSPTNVSLDCHNFVNILYWNYSKPTEQLKFIVMVKPYVSDLQTVETSQMHLNISEYTSDPADNYVVTVTAHDGKEKSEHVSVQFTYSSDFYNDNTHKCSVHFPDVNMSVHKDMIDVFFLHPYNFYKQDILKEVFLYRVTHDQRDSTFECLDDEELCTAVIHLNQSFDGQCIELLLEGMIAAIHTSTYRNVCVSVHKPTETGYIPAVIGVVVVLLFIAVGFVWILCKKWSRIPQIPKILEQSYMTTTPLLVLEKYFAYEIPTISPFQKDSSTFIPTDTQEEVNHDTSGLSEEHVNDIESGYDSRQFQL
ncbi:interferon gamma receptor 1-like isoform X1 [Xyrauchen texanus]|uniref:interferon gamma receptor 1-like isoform X1 n=1 Tax=Xyrauchen texanus TaxID=154827 RepID=UPI002241B8BC|nr:interferon gamma receptor 1-like isoform X1 [Xyrauchen texanus]